jgi:alpha-glucosidase (family GH31 glycosyl hydrolase)
MLKKNLSLFCLILYISVPPYAWAQVSEDSVTLTINRTEKEFWWVGIISRGHLMPLKKGFSANLLGDIYGNQAQPLLLSSLGNVVWSETPFIIACTDQHIIVKKKSGEFVSKKAGSSLREAYQYASKTYFPPSGSLPDKNLFAQPQYNTWIELLYNQNQTDILSYARSIIDNGFPPGVLMIDDNWQETYGTWKFHASRFPNPKAMVDTLHQWGFKVMLWICPFVSGDSEVFRNLMADNALLKEKDGYPKMVRWWNGSSAVLDFTNPKAKSWFDKQLQYLMATYKVDGFKFDAGDPEFYTNAYSYQPISANEHTELFAKIGIGYGLNEYRATWKMGGQPLAQRLRDKGHSWNDLQTLIPGILLQGIMGYPFTCPDMIGGGEMGSFINLDKVNQDLVVRSAQCHALMPMMQFSVAPWRVLDDAHLQAVKKAVAVRSQYTPLIERLADDAAHTGEPIVRFMAYEFPDEGFETISDQFMLGSDILVAPVLNAGTTRKVKLPKGKWKHMSESPQVIRGPKTIEVSADLNTLPIFIKQ